MLSNIGRGAIRRAGIGGPQSSVCRAGKWTWQLQRVCGNQDSSYAPQSNSRNESHQLQYSLKRSYVTATKAAAKPRATRTAAAKTTKTAAKKVDKPKAKAKPKPKPKKKVVAKKAKPVKKVLTEQQKAKRAEVKAKAEVKALKVTALLNQPKLLPATAWTVIVREAMQDVPAFKANGLTGQAAAAAVKYKNLTPSERESYNHIANQNKAANEVTYKNWVESYTPDQIRSANLARLQLKRKKLVARLPSPESIKDIRQPSRGVTNAHAAFTVHRHQSGDLKGLTLAEASQTIAKEYAALSPSEKKPFEDKAASDRLRYEQEYKTVFHRETPSARAAARA